MFLMVVFQDKKYIVNLSEKYNWNYITLNKKGRVQFYFGPDEVPPVPKEYSYVRALDTNSNNLNVAIDWLSIS